MRCTLAGHSDACNWTYLLKLAFAERLALTVSVQVELVPVQAPDQPVKFLPAGGVAVSVTLVPAA